MNQTVLNVVLCGLLLPCAQAVTLRIYPEFTEIRRPVQIQNRLLELNFSQVQLGNMVGGSLYLSGPKVLSRLQTVNTGKGSLERFEGQVVYLREAGQVRAVRLIRASDGLVQDLKTLRFRTGISLAQLEFAKPPLPNLASTVRYRYTTASSGPATVSLITRGISWQPRYVLSVTDNGSTLEAWADITNHEATLKVDSSELIAGQVQLVSSNGAEQNVYDQARLKADMTPAPSVGVTPTNRTYAPQVSVGSEQQGIYSYTLNRGYTLPTNSMYSLPFLEPIVTVKRVARLETEFYSGFVQGKFQRLYRLSSNILLPSGIATVRDAGKVVGSQTLPDLTAFEERDLQIGQDPDLRYIRYVKSVNSTKKKIYGKMQRIYTYTTFTITLQFKNTKSRAIPYEYLERLEQVRSNISVEGANRTAKGLSLLGTLPAHSQIEKKYQVLYYDIGELTGITTN